MLSPSYLLHAPEPAEEIAEKLHQDILQRIIERILRRIERGDGYILTAQDKWQLETIQEAGFLLDEVQKEITAAIPPMQTEIAQAMEDAGVVAMEYDDAIYQAAGLHPVGLTQSPHLIRILQRTYEATLGEWENVTRTTAEAAQRSYIQACDKAYYLAATNAMTASQAVKEALDEIITDGVVVKYPSGHTDSIEAATARAVRTGISQGAAQIQTARMDEFGIDLVIVSAHLGARPSHFEWQGKVYSRSGATDKYPDFVSSTGYGTVTGLCGANCRHSFSPYFEGQDNPYDQFDSKENQKAYEMQQRQRTMERRIRDTKRRLMGYEAAGDTERYQRTAALLQKQNAAYDAYCKENGLTKQTDRISIAKWTRSEAARARATAKKVQISVANQEENGTINKKASNRKITEQGQVLNPMPSEEYLKIKEALTAQGVKVIAATSGDDLAYMLWMKAEGTYSNGWITHIGEIPSRGTLFEEIIHMTQARKYGELDSSDYVELYAREIEANRKLLTNSKVYKLDDLDIADIKRNLAAWEDAFKQKTGVSYDESDYRKNVFS